MGSIARRSSQAMVVPFSRAATQHLGQWQAPAEATIKVTQWSVRIMMCTFKVVFIYTPVPLTAAELWPDRQF